MSKESKAPRESSATEKDNNRIDDESIKTKSTVVLDNNSSAANENDEAAISSIRVVLLGILLLAIGAVGFYNLPGMIVTNAKGSKIVNSIYCSVITLTTYVLLSCSEVNSNNHLTTTSNSRARLCRIGFVRTQSSLSHLYKACR